MKQNVANIIKIQAGVTIVELMVALLLASGIGLAVMQLMQTNSANYNFTTALTSIQENGHFGIDFMSQDLRMAGYKGSEITFYGTLGDVNAGQFLSRTKRIASQFDTTIAAVQYPRRFGKYDGYGYMSPFVFAGSYVEDTQFFDKVTMQRLIMPGEYTCSGEIIENGPELVMATYFVENNELKCRTVRPDLSGGIAAPFEDVLLSGVEAFQVLYGIDFRVSDNGGSGRVTAEGNGVAKAYVDGTTLQSLLSGSLADSGVVPRVVALRFALLVRGEAASSIASLAANNEYQVLDQRYAAADLPVVAGENFIRRVYSSTINLRNIERPF